MRFHIVSRLLANRLSAQRKAPLSAAECKDNITCSSHEWCRYIACCPLQSVYIIGAHFCSINLAAARMLDLFAVIPSASVEDVSVNYVVGGHVGGTQQQQYQRWPKQRCQRHQHWWRHSATDDVIVNVKQPISEPETTCVHWRTRQFLVHSPYCRHWGTCCHMIAMVTEAWLATCVFEIEWRPVFGMGQQGWQIAGGHYLRVIEIEWTAAKSSMVIETYQCQVVSIGWRNH